MAASPRRLPSVRTIKELDRAVGGLTNTSKMPGKSFSLSAHLCNVGGKLSKVEGSVCSKCYAKKGHYVQGNVIQAQARRLSKLKTLRVWTEDMVELLSRASWPNAEFFRWFDSGDLRGPKLLQAIIEIAERVPHVNFWLPTKEYELANKGGSNAPSNLVIRVSSPLIGQRPLPVREPLKTSTVDSGEGYSCPAYKQGGSCGPCRACWDHSVGNVDYPLH